MCFYMETPLDRDSLITSLISIDQIKPVICMYIIMMDIYRRIPIYAAQIARLFIIKYFLKTRVVSLVLYIHSI